MDLLMVDHQLTISLIFKISKFSGSMVWNGHEATDLVCTIYSEIVIVQTQLMNLYRPLG
uniref:Uncharacterized protein n=1 Tax=Arundo donax TaxID=35708 RepID=A0A0A9A727_ARUDO